MKLTINTKCQTAMTEREYLQVSRLHFRDGMMWPYFSWFKDKRCGQSNIGTSNGDLYTDGHVCLVKHGNQVVGWAHVYTTRSFGSRRSIKRMHIYVMERFRRQGIGRWIFDTCRKKFGRWIWCDRHDDVATAFFDAVDAY